MTTTNTETGQPPASNEPTNRTEQILKNYQRKEAEVFSNRFEESAQRAKFGAEALNALPASTQQALSKEAAHQVAHAAAEERINETRAVLRDDLTTAYAAYQDALESRAAELQQQLLKAVSDVDDDARIRIATSSEEALKQIADDALSTGHFALGDLAWWNAYRQGFDYLFESYATQRSDLDEAWGAAFEEWCLASSLIENAPTSPLQKLEEIWGNVDRYEAGLGTRIASPTGNAYVSGRAGVA